MIMKQHIGTRQLLNLRQLFGAKVFCLLLVYVLGENSLVLEHIPLHLQIQAVIPSNRKTRDCSAQPKKKILANALGVSTTSFQLHR